MSATEAMATGTVPEAGGEARSGGTARAPVDAPHRRRHRIVRGVVDDRVVRGTNGGRAGYLGSGGALRAWLYSWTCPAGLDRAPVMSAREPDDGNPHRVVLRTVRYSLHLRIERSAEVAGRSRPNGRQGRQELRHVGRSVVLGGHGRRARGGGAGGDRPPARRVPQDLQLLPDVPPVHVWRLLESQRGPLPDLRPDGRHRGARVRARATGCRRGCGADQRLPRGRAARVLARGGPDAGSPGPRARHGRGIRGCRGGGGRGPVAARGRRGERRIRGTRRR